MLAGWLEFLAERASELWLRTGEHLILTGVSTTGAILVGIPLGILASRAAWLRSPLVGAVGILQTIPSLAMLALLLALLAADGTYLAIIALTLYALLPIVRNTMAGIEGLSSDVLEAACGIGMTPGQRLRMVEIPLALPVIMAGIRTAAVVGVGIATLSAFIGAGGLGVFINRGLALSNPRLILLGAIPAAILALIVDFSLGGTQWALQPTRQADRHTFKAKLKPVALSLPLLLVAIGVAAWGTHRSPTPTATIRMGSKNFTEQFILGELMAQLLEAHTDLAVDRGQFNLGGTAICHQKLVNGQIDLYPEYTGTGLINVLKREVVTDPAEALRIVRAAYLAQFQATWLEPFGFNNTYTIVVRRRDADREGWSRVSDLAAKASDLRAGFTAEFVERPDGYPGLAAAYGFEFGTVRDFDPALMYGAIAEEQVDVISAFATDGRIPAYDLEPLVDDRGFFPPYQAAPVVRSVFLEDHPRVREVLSRLSGLIDDAAMQQLNYQVDENKRSPAEVAREFLSVHNLLE